MTLRRAGLSALALTAAGVLAWTAISQTEQAKPDPDVALSPDLEQGNGTDAAPPATPGRQRAPKPVPVTTDTPMADRVAVIGLLNKRNGIARDAVLHPGHGVRWGNLVVRLRACETTADWEPEQLTGAFVQADRRSPDGTWRRIFSGWLYKESPSLNTVEDPLYDIWPKSCTMRHPETGPDTVAASGGGGAPSRSIAKKSAREGSAPEEAEPSPSALSNSAT